MKKVLHTTLAVFTTTLLSAVILLFVAIPGFSQDVNNKVLAEIAGEKITVSDFMQVYNKNNVQASGIEQSSLEDYLELYINFRLKVKEAYSLGLDTVATFKQELSGYRAQLAKPYMVDEKATERLTKEAFERMKEDMRASHILIRVDRTASPADTIAALKKALNIRERIMKGESFSAMAAELSEDQSARDRDMGGRMVPGNKGDLGFFTAFDMVYPFETGAYALKKNEVSRPVRTDYGYHLIYLSDRKPAMGKLLAAHILFLYPNNASSQDSMDLRDKAQMVYDQLRAGGNFEELANTYSDDRSTADKGGVLQWFGVNRMIPDFIVQLSQLENIGDYSQPFQTMFGYHIVKLLDQKKPGTFEESLAEIKEKVQKNERSTVIKESLVARIKKDYAFKVNQKSLQTFYTLVNDSVFAANWSYPYGAKLNKQLFNIGSKKYSQKDFAVYLAKNQKPGAPTDITVYVDNAFKLFTEQELLDYEDKQLEKKYPEFRALIGEYRDGILLFELTDSKIWSKAVKDTLGLEAFYEQDRYNYMWGERVDASLFKFSTTDPAFIEQVRQMAEKEVPNTDILEQVNSEGELVSVQRKVFAKGDNELIDSIDWTYGAKQVTDKDNRTSLIVIHNTIEPGPKMLHEARGLITADYQNHLEKEWIKELRVKYPVKVNYDLLPQIKQ